MENKEDWVKKTLDSIDDIQRADVPRHLAERFLKTATLKNNIISIRPMAKWLVAATLVVLAGLNVVSIIHYKKPSDVQTKSNPVYNEYFAFLSNY